MLTTTVGRLIVNDALPPDLRNYGKTMDKKAITELMQELATKHPEKYREVSQRLLNIGRETAYQTGGYSFGVKHLRTSPAIRKLRTALDEQVGKIMAGPGSNKEKEEQILIATDAVREKLSKQVYDDALASKNPLAMQVLSGARGNPSNLNRLIGADLLYEDHRGKTIPFPVTRSYGEGVKMADYFAASFGARKGLVDVKLGTAKGGFFSKQLNQLAHRLLVTSSDEDEDSEHQPETGGVRGLPVSVDDEDNVGSVLARAFGPYKRNTVITPRIQADLANLGFNRILVRSPLIGGPESGGVYARDVGIREKGGFPSKGELVGLAAAQALSERLTQGALGSKHTGGTKGAAPAASGFAYLNQMIQVPETFKGGAAHSQLDGHVERVVPAPAGGHFVFIDGKSHYVGGGFNVNVKPGQVVEAGDVLSDGIPNPAEIVKHKGIGEGRRYFVKAFQDGFKNSGIGANRRNVELVARGLIDYVELTDEHGEHVPGDIVPYNNLERTWTPREGYQSITPNTAVGQYLERPILHHSIGTQIKKSMLPEFEEFGVNKIDVHQQPPPFQPQMLRALDASGHDPDWFSRLIASYQKRNILDAVHRGRESDEAGTSFVPSLARGIDFGKTWPKAAITPPKPL